MSIITFEFRLTRTLEEDNISLYFGWKGIGSSLKMDF